MKAIIRYYFPHRCILQNIFYTHLVIWNQDIGNETDTTHSGRSGFRISIREYYGHHWILLTLLSIVEQCLWMWFVCMFPMCLYVRDVIFVNTTRLPFQWHILFRFNIGLFLLKTMRIAFIVRLQEHRIYFHYNMAYREKCLQ